ncbi:FAD assembly factor SdhE [Thioalkalivibrio sp. HK1]|uniref:FAD assembly factor SdhE n=1 Tax=Thioalkalivibrio sp. HK1 TaxID=1469245 RepID=UPI00046FF288|nr:succinate dehydrogenase assembly factor 2 [Thioalkalivibrio sp. HK1]
MASEPKPESKSASALPRLRWRCRRGMKELDAFFEPFVRCALDDLAKDQRIALERLLDRPDREILDWLVDDSDRIPGGFRRIIRSIRSCHPFYRSAFDDATGDGKIADIGEDKRCTDAPSPASEDRRRTQIDDP